MGHRPQGRRHDHLLLGRDGEDRAAAHYEAAGYRVLDRNWRCPEGELDLVLVRDRVLVVCEVKTRSSTRFGSPLEAVDRTRQRRLRRAASAWLTQHGDVRPATIRFDVAAVIGGRVQVVEAAF
jgi:putative endonuclease